MSAQDERTKTAGSSAVLLICFLVGLGASLLVGWVIFPALLYSEKEQPIDFSHVVHVDAVGDCEGCHYFRDDGSFSGIPDLSNCAECHEEAQGEDPEELKMIQEYIEPGKEIPWMVYSRQPDCVFFSHAAHVNMGEIECKACHGMIGESEHTDTYEYNILTGYSRNIWGKNISGLTSNTWESMKMGDCGNCHDEHGENNACFVCHK